MKFCYDFLYAENPKVDTWKVRSRLKVSRNSTRSTTSSWTWSGVGTTTAVPRSTSIPTSCTCPKMREKRKTRKEELNRCQSYKNHNKSKRCENATHCKCFYLPNTLWGLSRQGKCQHLNEKPFFSSVLDADV
jgi:hypothetical protein